MDEIKRLTKSERIDQNLKEIREGIKIAFPWIDLKANEEEDHE